MTGVDFTQIDGLDVLTVQTILSETGLNPHAFPTMKQFTSWLALCPDNRVTGGKVKSTRTRKVANRAARANTCLSQCRFPPHEAAIKAASNKPDDIGNIAASTVNTF